MIKANAHSDDRIVEVEFDAEPWFEQATDDQITELAACGWEGDQQADDVATWTNDEHPEAGLEPLFDHLSNMKGSRGATGFECSVDEESAMEWLEEEKPELHELILENQKNGSW